MFTSINYPSHAFSHSWQPIVHIYINADLLCVVRWWFSIPYSSIITNSQANFVADFIKMVILHSETAVGSECGSSTCHRAAEVWTCLWDTLRTSLAACSNCVRSDSTCFYGVLSISTGNGRSTTKPTLMGPISLKCRSTPYGQIFGSRFDTDVDPQKDHWFVTAPFIVMLFNPSLTVGHFLPVSRRRFWPLSWRSRYSTSRLFVSTNFEPVGALKLLERLVACQLRNYNVRWSTAVRFLTLYRTFDCNCCLASIVWHPAGGWSL